MRNKLLLIFLAVIISGCFSTVFAGEIDDNLAEILASKSGSEIISVLVYLDDQVDLQTLTNQLDNQKATLQNRHQTIVHSLQQKATYSQPSFIAFLDGLKSDGTINDYKSFWVVNALRVDCSKNAIEVLMNHRDIGTIYYNYKTELIEPVDTKKDISDLITGVETGLQAIRAPEVWAMGITGAGVLVANIDTGVEGSHPALSSRWAGVADSRYAGHPEWAWYDPYLGQNDFPYDYNGHGTHTMGSITGASSTTGDTVGAAPGALWIAAGAIDRGGSIERTVADAIASFEWMLNPDGDPSTGWDVPDVCSNSWGVTTSHGYPPCDPLFWSYLDACEAAGILIVFAAGNEGSSGLRRPSDRATDDYRTFAVAAVDGNTSGWPIAYFSSRGPTYCTPGGEAAIKPDISAPGVSVRSCYPGGGYVSMSGTSMATPHIAGVVALIREANPNLSVNEIKQIIFDTAYDLGVAGEDNSYGWGMVDAYEAVLLAMGGNFPPVADFSGSPTSGYAPLTVNFTDLSSNDPTSWSWDFGDGIGTSTQRNPAYTYNNYGTYTVTLIATNAYGSDTEIKVDYITVDQPTPPVADFSADPTTGYVPLTVQFTDLSQNSPTSWNWDFGDGIGTSAEQNPSYTYNSVGIYTVTLTADNAFGSDTETKTDYIAINEQMTYSQAFAQSDMPVIGIMIGTYVNTHLSDNVYETITEETYTGHPRKRYSYLEHKWDFNISNGSNITFYLEAYRPDNSDGDNFIFEYSTDDITYLPLVTVASSLEQTYSVPLPSSITGTVYLRVTDSNRSWEYVSNDAVYIDNMYFEFESTPAPPAADFSGIPTSGNAPLTVQFTDLSTNNPTSWNWDFGDGSGTSTEKNPAYTYTVIGAYTVILTAANSYGSDTETKTDYITVTDIQPGTIHVHDIQVTRRKVGPNYKGVGTIFIYNETNLPVSGATVYVTATGPTGGALSGITGSDGSVILETAAIKKPVGEWCFEITDVTHSWDTYDPDANIVTMACESGSIYKGIAGQLPYEFNLVQNYPNPFNASTEISFTLAEPAYVILEIFNIAGQKIDILANGLLETGSHSVTWHASGYPSGMYFYNIKVGSYSETKKMILLK